MKTTLKTHAMTRMLHQSCGLRNWTMGAILLPILFMTGMAQAQTNIVYQDQFARTGLLNGSTPDTVDTGGATWWASTNVAFNSALYTGGSEIIVTNFPNPTNGFYLNGFLPFTPQVGHVYTYTMSAYGILGGNQWLAMGFSQSEFTNNFYAGAAAGAAWLLVRASGANYQPFPGPGTANGTTVNLTGGAITNAFKIILDTTTGNASAGWTVTFFCNGVQGYQFVYAAGNPGIHFVGCGVDAATGYFQNFQLTDYAAPPTAPLITETPQNVTAGVGQTATFWVNVNGAPAPAYQWLTNSVGGPTNAIVGATNATYTTPPLTVALYNGLLYSVQVTNIVGSTNSAPATLTVSNLKPTVYSAEKSVDLVHAVVVFSEAVDPVTGLNAANYTLNNGATVSSASYGTMSNSVVLSTSALNTNFLYSLTVQNVQDQFGNTATNTTVPLLPAGLAIYLRADSGIVLDSSSAVAEWIDQTTNGNNVVQYVGGHTDRPTPSTMNNASAVNFSSSPGNYLTAPTSPSLAITGAMTIYTVVNFADLSAPREILSKSVGSNPSPYDYFVNSSTGTEVLTRGNGQNLGTFTSTAGAVANVAQVLAVTGSTNTGIVTHYLNGNANGSGTLTVGAPSSILDLGHPLFIGGRADLQQFMNGTIGEVMVYNGILSAADRTNVDNYLGTKYCNYSVTTDLPATLTTTNGYAVTFNFAAGQGSAHELLQWQENGTNIPGATGQSYTTPILAPADNGDKFDVLVTFFNGGTTNSTTNTLTVLNQPPFVLSAGIALWNSNNIVVLFNEAVDPTTATVAGNYSLAPAGNVLSAAMGDVPNKVVLSTTTAWNANPGYYTLTAANVKDVYGNTMATAPTSVGLYPLNVALWVKANNGVTTNANGAVTLWNDLSGNVNNLQQATVYQMLEPVLTNSALGFPVVHFVVTNTGSLNYGSGLHAFDSSSLEIVGDMSVIEVVNFTTPAFGAGQGEIISKTGLNNPNVPAPYDYDVSATGPNALRGNGGSLPGTIPAGSFGQYKATTTISTNHTHIVGFSQGGITVSHYLDGNISGTGVLGANGGGNFNMVNCADQGQDVFVGNREDDNKFNAEHLGGDLTELIVAGSALSTNDMALLQNYLAAEYTVPVGTNSYPAITQQPVASTNVYQTTTLSVPAAASGNPLAYQWYGTNGVAIAGQTGPTLVITNMQTTNAYYLVVTNTYGSATSSTVFVNVLPVNVNPTNIVFLVSGNTNLVLNWPLDHTGWQLQVQTNSLAAGLNTNWVKMTSSSATNQVIMPINVKNGSVFYRLVFPPQ